MVLIIKLFLLQIPINPADKFCQWNSFQPYDNCYGTIILSVLLFFKELIQQLFETRFKIHSCCPFFQYNVQKQKMKRGKTRQNAHAKLLLLLPFSITCFSFWTCLTGRNSIMTFVTTMQKSTESKERICRMGPCLRWSKISLGRQN